MRTKPILFVSTLGALLLVLSPTSSKAQISGMWTCSPVGDERLYVTQDWSGEIETYPWRPVASEVRLDADERQMQFVSEVGASPWTFAVLTQTEATASAYGTVGNQTFLLRLSLTTRGTARGVFVETNFTMYDEFTSAHDGVALEIFGVACRQEAPT